MKAMTHSWLFGLLLLVGCGGGSPNEEQIEEQVDTDEITLEIARDFDFDITREVTVNFTPPNGEEGAYHLFSERVSGIDEVIAEPSSKIATVPSSIRTEIITVNNNWSTLYVEWHPQTADAEQQSLAIALGTLTSINVQFN